MNTERLAEIRLNVKEGKRIIWDTRDLLDYVDELTRQRDDARALAVKSGIFQDHFAEVYPQAHEEQPLVGPVAWDKQVQQR